MVRTRLGIMKGLARQKPGTFFSQPNSAFSTEERMDHISSCTSDTTTSVMEKWWRMPSQRSQGMAAGRPFLPFPASSVQRTGKACLVESKNFSKQSWLPPSSWQFTLRKASRAPTAVSTSTSEKQLLFSAQKLTVEEERKQEWARLRPIFCHCDAVKCEPVSFSKKSRTILSQVA